MYTGKDADDSGPLAKRVVLNLHHQGQCLYFDNFYTSPGNSTNLDTSMCVLHIFYKNQTKDQLSI